MGPPCGVLSAGKNSDQGCFQRSDSDLRTLRHQCGVQWGALLLSACESQDVQETQSGLEPCSGGRSWPCREIRSCVGRSQRRSFEGHVPERLRLGGLDEDDRAKVQRGLQRRARSVLSNQEERLHGTTLRRPVGGKKLPSGLLPEWSD